MCPSEAAAPPPTQPAVQMGIAMTTNITEEHRRVFEALSSAYRDAIANLVASATTNPLPPSPP